MDLTSMTSKGGKAEQEGSACMWKEGSEICLKMHEKGKNLSFHTHKWKKQTAYDHTDVQDDLEQTFL